MKNSELQEYWRWKMVRQVSTFINDPDAPNTETLLEMIRTYPDVKQSINTPDSSIRIEPPAAYFVCAIDS